MTKSVKVTKATETAPATTPRVIPMVNINKKDWTKICSTENLTTKSAKIRWLASQEHPRAAIARFLEIRYQHVRNVLTQPIKRVAEPKPTAPATK